MKNCKNAVNNVSKMARDVGEVRRKYTCFRSDVKNKKKGQLKCLILGEERSEQIPRCHLMTPDDINMLWSVKNGGSLYCCYIFSITWTFTEWNTIYFLTAIRFRSHSTI